MTLSGDWPARPEVGVVCGWFSTNHSEYPRTNTYPLGLFQTALRSVQPFLHRLLQGVPIFCSGTPFPLPLKIASTHGGSGLLSNTWFPGPTRVLNPNGISVGSAVFGGLTSVTERPTDRPTDRPRCSATRWVAIGRIYLRSTARRPKNNNNQSLK